ncbi:Xanthine dehydrogenase/oxidase [Rhynchospora pubera]|uniref:xanthine dehydrogenase n=1 Tax=Rhynchospora pubera TaxID=906938 RepID=A0AAV8D8H5_9POAL|nr:Xanthine dehydrogenase/oxidase [Rhynchospora pubera]
MGSITRMEDEELEMGVEWSSEAVLYVNGVRRVLPDGLAHLTLLEYLRDIGLTGTKLGCGEGGCGACTVMASFYDQDAGKSMHYAINACLAPLYSVEGMHIITVEGVGDSKFGLHPIQESLVKAHGSQCGFCTPGFIMSMYALLRSNKQPPTEEQIEESLAGNLCRCTGYRPIIDAFRVYAKTDNSLYCNASPAASIDGSIICPSTGKPCSCGEATVKSEKTKQISYNEIDGNKYHERELIFPPELVLRTPLPLQLKGFGGIKWYRPLSLQHVLNLRKFYPSSKLVIGNSEVGIETKFKNAQYNALISVTHVSELNVLKVREDGIEIGSSVRLARLEQTLKRVVEEREAHETSSCRAILGQLKWFAGTQIRNVASVGGNICTASPISDLNPLWMATGARFQIIDSKGNVRSVPATEFFLGYRKVDLRQDEILLSVFLPWTRHFEFVKEFKQAHRREDDIALVNAGMRVYLKEIDGGDWVVSDISLVYGGVAAVPLSASKTVKLLSGKTWDEKSMLEALDLLKDDVVISDDAPGGMVEFRRSLTLSFFFKFFMWVQHEMSQQGLLKNGLSRYDLSSIEPYSRPPSSGSQNYEVSQLGTSVGLPKPHLSANLQVTGAAEYTDDISTPPNTLHAALVLSKLPHARVVAIDDSAAKSSPGFAGLFLASDVPASNAIGPIARDEEVFASKVVTCVGQVIGVIVADTHENAKAAARKIKITYEELPAILSIREAIQAGSFHPNSDRCMQKGDVEKCFGSSLCDRIIEGEVQVGGQEHFYMEPNCSLVWTVDSGNEVHMISSTQSPQKHQDCVARVLGLPLSKVVCKAKRIGGGFGGKETRSAFVAAAASVAAYHLKRPVKIVLDRDVDMAITGHRHSFLGKYKVGFTNEGKILALDLELYNNGGNSFDLSQSVLERAMFMSENVYDIPNMRVRGKVCFTNFPSNTAFRGFGAPQGNLIAENWIQRIAMELQKSPEDIRELNFHGEGYETHYGQLIEHSTLKQVWEELKTSCDFARMQQEAASFNHQNRWRKRGVAMVPTKFGISFTSSHLNQAGALVQVYTDGTVLVTHGGVEMGQGLHTKVAQIAASCFNIPLNSVFISETSTDKVPNASPTAASASSDMYGAAVLDACEQIVARMQPVASKNKHGSFAELARMCHFERIDLSAHGFYITPGIHFDFKVGKGVPFNYFTYGAAFAEVEIDTLTGDFYTRSADISMDLGRSLNPAIDIGQIEGAFVQGMGWIAFEELKWGDSSHKWIKPGNLFTCGPGTYKIPSVNDIPLKFNVSILKGVGNPKAIHSSKAVGEPPFFLAACVLFAIKDAIIAARADSGHNEWFPLDNPVTPERIRMACLDMFTKKFVDTDFRPKLSV